jgi:hypothetical protein
MPVGEQAEKSLYDFVQTSHTIQSVIWASKTKKYEQQIEEKLEKNRNLLQSRKSGTPQ